MRKGRKRYTKKSVIQAAIPTLFLVVLVCVGAYYIQQGEWIQPEIDEITASYLSLNNNETTDMMKITNLHKMSDKNGHLSKNKCSKNFQITGKKDATYQIVLYHLGNRVEEEYIKFYLTNEKEQFIENILSNMPDSPDGGKIIFEGTMEDGKKWKLKMWVDKSYKYEVTNVSYEVKIKTS